MKKMICLLLTAILCVTAFVGCGNSKGSSDVDKTSKESKTVLEATFDDLKCGMSFTDVQTLFGEPTKVDLNPQYPNVDAYIWEFDKFNLVANEGKKAKIYCYFSDDKLNYAEAAYSVSNTKESEKICNSWLSKHSLSDVKKQEEKEVTSFNGVVSYKSENNYLKLTLKNLSINSFQEDPKEFNNLKCGMSRDQVAELLGEPQVVNSNGDYWYFKNNGTYYGTNCEPAYVMVVCCFSGGSLYSAAYYLAYPSQGWETLSNVESDIQSGNSPFSNYYPDDIPEGEQTIMTKNNAKSMSVSSFDGFVYISFDNYDYYKNKKQDDNTSDGKVGDNNGDGKVDEKDWEIEWKDYLDKKMN